MKKQKKQAIQKPVPQPDMMDRARAARAYLEAGHNNENLKMFAFLSIFNPEITPERALQLCRKERP